MAQYNKEADELSRNSKAMKSNETEVPEYLWNDIIAPDGIKTNVKELNQFHQLGLQW